MKRTEISTDGSQKPMTRAGGWGVVIRDGDAVRTLDGVAKNTTANRMELRAILEGMKTMEDGAAVSIRSDSRYALNVARGEWTARKNRDLVNAVRAEAERLNVKWVKVKGHAGDPDNERADDLAESNAAAVHARTVGESEGPFVVRGETRPHNDTLKAHGLTWTGDAWATLDDEAFLRAVYALGAEMQTDTAAVVRGRGGKPDAEEL